ncbi:fimbria/pilus periplasmic chaperone [Photobacterium sp. 1_MG-2023]|uniref:fimbria/pilus periplasmic chaperone n=1 Tax=Photobacterium sp. 1_MG-2023 TaxID=3062646 RepID=UPI0026E12E90|nr:fimbria/pilus periplasmic chaperone [Photobacterium sp. 1_MG-2023]MDO6708549.1 fimbria/pilus periplasmic chaperone [Photobacterium sp. 1_MG-2023]
MKWMFIALLWGVSWGCLALEVGPLVHEIQSDAAVRSTKVMVRNNSAATQLVDAQVMQLHFEPDGYSASPATRDDLIVMPPAFRIAPGRSQVLMLMWTGTAPLKTSQSYSVQLSAMNQDTENQRNHIAIQINYNVIVHVASGQHQERLQSTPISVRQTPNGIDFMVQNLGSKYTKLSHYDLSFSSPGQNQPEILTGDLIANSESDAFIPAGQTTEIHLPKALLSGRTFGQVTLKKRQP